MSHITELPGGGRGRLIVGSNSEDPATLGKGFCGNNCFSGEVSIKGLFS